MHQKAIRTIDALLEQLATAYRALPKRPYLARDFRNALAFVGVPGGYVASGECARPLSESLKGKQHA